MSKKISNFVGSFVSECMFYANNMLYIIGEDTGEKFLLTPSFLKEYNIFLPKGSKGIELPIVPKRVGNTTNLVTRTCNYMSETLRCVQGIPRKSKTNQEYQSHIFMFRNMIVEGKTPVVYAVELPFYFPKGMSNKKKQEVGNKLLLLIENRLIRGFKDHFGHYKIGNSLETKTSEGSTDRQQFDSSGNVDPEPIVFERTPKLYRHLYSHDAISKIVEIAKTYREKNPTIDVKNIRLIDSYNKKTDIFKKRFVNIYKNKKKIK